MFNQDEDWNDEQDAQILSQTVFKNTQNTNSSSNVKSSAVGKKSLMRTLQTLGAVPEWKSDNHPQDSDSETEAAPSHSKKKKRSKKRKHAKTSEEHQGNRDLHQSDKEKPVTKKRKKDNKFDSPKAKTTSVCETTNKELTKSTKAEVNKTEKMERLGRKQWKNKMKNKRKCNNKYRQKKTEEVNNTKPADKQRPKENVKTDPYSKNNSSKYITQTAVTKKKKEKEHKPQKKKINKEDVLSTTATQTQRERKQQIEKEPKTKVGQVKKRATESSADGSKQKAGELEVTITDYHTQLPTKSLKPELSKEQSVKREKLRKMLHSHKEDQQESPVEQKEEPVAPQEEVKQDRSASLRSRMEQRLESARFRYINEVLYSTSSSEAKRMFKQDPQAFWIYHRGYTAQVQRWPTNPLDAIISYIRLKPSSLVVADFGCGDCKIAQSVKNKVHSFDLAAACELVTVCDMANVPLDDGSVDIAVFCLSLMGTNLADFIVEANRVLKMGGVLIIAEVASRFDNIRSFVTALANLGFKAVSKDTENTHFYSFEFVKTGDSPENIKKFGLQLQPCVYKKR